MAICFVEGLASDENHVNKSADKPPSQFIPDGVNYLSAAGSPADFPGFDYRHHGFKDVMNGPELIMGVSVELYPRFVLPPAASSTTM